MFALFWAACPKKTGKLDAIKAWNKLAPEEELVNTMIEALKAQSEVTERQFMKDPSGWINGRRWEDEIVVPEPRRRISDEPRFL